MFNPLRSRLQRLVEQRFNRARHSAELTVNQLTDRLRDVTDVPGVKEAGRWAVAAIVQPSTMSIWVRKN